nr:ribonuclease H-like domain-containing protein [Tanacetum cinerariifolium]
DSGFDLSGFSDVDYAGCKDTFKSTSGGAQFLGEKLIPIYCDSKSAIAISCNPVQHSRTKHIVFRCYFIKENVEKGTIELHFVKTDYKLADLFTKSLPVDRFIYLVRRLGMSSLSPQELDRLAKSQLKLPQQLSGVHSTFHLSNLKKCLSDEPLAITLDELHIDDKLRFVEEPVEIMDREIKRLRQSCIPIIKVRWNSK